ncbi:MAG: CHAT domain-containing protein [Candidatus Latescibacterota bacterium]|nr:MAG: CHAT domain-containing protein [Candidatus Latescibacterota bacterium]
MPTRRLFWSGAAIAVVLAAWVVVQTRLDSRDPSNEERIQELLRGGQYAQATELARELVSRTESTAPDSERLATALDLLVESMWRAGSAGTPEARALAARSLQIREQLHGPDAGPVVSSLIQQTRLLQLHDDHAEAIQTSRRALAIAEEQIADTDPRMAMVLKQLGYGFWGEGKYEAARDRFEQALEAFHRARDVDPMEETSILNGMAIVAFQTGDYPSARRHFERILEIRQEHLGPDHQMVAGICNNLGILLAMLGDYDAARAMYERAIEIRTRIDADPALLASSLNNLAIVLEKFGDLEGARQRYERALQLTIDVLGTENLSVSNYMRNLGWLHYEKHDYARARDYYSKAFEITAACVGMEHTAIADLLRDQGTLYVQLGQPDSARAAYDRCLAIYERHLGPEHPQVAVALALLAYAEAGAGNRAAALETALRAESIGREHMRLTSRTLAEREALLYSGVRARGLEFALHLTATTPASDLETARVWDAVVRSRALVLDEMATRTQVVSNADQTHVVALAESLAAARNHLAALVVRGPSGDGNVEHRAALREARRAKESFERRLAEVSATFREQLTRSEIGFDDVQASVPESGALVSYMVYEIPRGWQPEAATLASALPASRSEPPFGSDLVEYGVPHLAALVFRPGRAPQAVALGEMKAIRQRVSEWAREASLGVAIAGRNEQQAEEAYRRRGEALREAVWDRLLPALSDAQKVFVVPDAELHFVNFAALPLERDRYLIDAGRPIHYLTSERELVPHTQPQPAGVGLLALGGPDFDDVTGLEVTGITATPRTNEIVYRSPRFDRPQPPCAGFESLHFSPLPGTANEIRAVDAIWKGSHPGATDVFLAHKEATEARFKRVAPGKRVLHLATHGFFLGGVCEAGDPSTRSLASKGSSQRARWVPTPLPSPLLQAGLVMAGANRRGEAVAGSEDGILMAEEIAALDLRGVELAVLSACDTGIGQAQAGEGVLGLRHAFQVAGVRSLVMSLWPVSDESTRDWMQAFYRARFDKRMSVADAVHASSLAELQKQRSRSTTTHPFYWASFVSAGAWQ